MEKNSPKSDPPKNEQAVDTSAYNSPGVIFSKPTPQGEKAERLTQNNKRLEEMGEQGQEETQDEYSSKIQSLRTYEKDLEEAKKRAGEGGGKDNVQSKENVKSTPASRTSREKKILRRQVEQELAKSGIVPQEDIDALPDKNKETSLKTVRTYKDDATSSIQDKNLSAVSIAAAESKKRAEQRRNLRPSDKPSTFARSLTIIVISLTLVASGIAVSTFFYKASKKGSGIEARKEITSLIFADAQIEIDISELSDASLLERLNRETQDSNTSLGGVVHLLLTEKGLSGQTIVSSKRFLRKISGNIPDRFIRSLDDTFMLGVHTLGGNYPFLVFKTQSFDNAFASMLDWEETMNEDLSPLFGDILSEITTKGTEQVDSTALLSRIFIPRIFSDVIVRNNDTRILRDDEGGIALIYGFPRVDTIIIATHENTFFEVFKRMTVARTEPK